MAVQEPSGGGIGIALGYTVILITLALWTEFKTRAVQQKLTAQISGDPVDEDDMWLFGMIYHNSNDRHILKNDRVGMGMTINIGRPGGKILGGLSALLILTMPLWGLILIHEEFTPPALKVEGSAVYALHTGPKYEIPFSDIQSAELLFELPPMPRTAGTDMETLQKGRFRTADGEDCRLCLDPTQPPFLKIKTPELTYYLADRNPENTERVYEAVRLVPDA